MLGVAQQVLLATHAETTTSSAQNDLFSKRIRTYAGRGANLRGQNTAGKNDHCSTSVVHIGSAVNLWDFSFTTSPGDLRCVS
eukprot:4465851-Amphidinium_carterae.2